MTTKVAGSGRPRDDVDLLALQLADDRLDAAAAHADAGADRVDAAVARDDRDLGAAAGVARHRLDLDDAVVDLRHFLREQLGHELRVGARQENLRAARLLADVVDIGAHPLALAEAFARQQLVAAQHRLGAAEIDDDVAELDPLDEPVDDLADAVLELVELPLALGVADLLDDDLLCRLRGDAAKIDRRQRVGDEIADLGLGVQPLRLRERDLRRLVLDRVDHLAKPQQPDLAVAAVDLGADVVFLAVFGAAGLLDRLLHRLQDFVAVDALVARDGIGDLQQFRAGVGDGAFHGVLEFRASVGLGPRRGLRLARRSDQIVGEDELCPRDVGERQLDLARLGGQTTRCPAAVPSSRPRKRLRPSIGRASSIRASNPAKRS